ncbi:MAG: DUF192 domain-containing protein, partial [Nitrospirae bacterium]|nr:DUF192 domain-containing protein [Nitrospirota bacterium]
EKRDIPFSDRVFYLRHSDDTDLKTYLLNIKSPSDIIFLNAQKRISDFYKNMQPCKEISKCAEFLPSEPVRGVIIMKAGVLNKVHIEAGDRIEFH